MSAKPEHRERGSCHGVPCRRQAAVEWACDRRCASTRRPRVRMSVMARALRRPRSWTRRNPSEIASPSQRPFRFDDRSSLSRPFWQSRWRADRRGDAAAVAVAGSEGVEEATTPVRRSMGMGRESPVISTVIDPRTWTMIAASIRFGAFRSTTTIRTTRGSTRTATPIRRTTSRTIASPAKIGGNADARSTHPDGSRHRAATEPEAYGETTKPICGCRGSAKARIARLCSTLALSTRRYRRWRTWEMQCPAAACELGAWSASNPASWPHRSPRRPSSSPIGAHEEWPRARCARV